MLFLSPQQTNGGALPSNASQYHCRIVEKCITLLKHGKEYKHHTSNTKTYIIAKHLPQFLHPILDLKYIEDQNWTKTAIIIIEKIAFKTLNKQHVNKTTERTGLDK